MEDSKCFRGSLAGNNDVFQTVFFRFLTLAWKRGNSCEKEEEMLKTPLFAGILGSSGLVSPEHALLGPP